MLTSRFSSGRSVNYLGYSGFRPGGDGLTHFASGGTNHARKEPGRSRDSPVTLLHCSIRTRRIRTVLAIRRAQRGSQAQGWRVRTVAGIRPANPFLAWIHGSVPEVQPRPCGMVSDRFGEHPCAGEGQLGVPLPGVASRTGQPRISSGRRVALCAGLSAGSSALHRPAVACRCALPRNRSREDRKTSLQPTRSPGRAPVSAGRTARTRPGGSRCAPGAHARRSVHVQLLPLCVLVCSDTRCGRRGHLMVRSLSSEAIWS
jgi:hypothetical protein